MKIQKMKIIADEKFEALSLAVAMITLIIIIGA